VNEELHLESREIDKKMRYLTIVAATGGFLFGYVSSIRREKQFVCLYNTNVIKISSFIIDVGQKYTL